jgi:cytosine/adenosine deaminase-related metal-dependent hydrolase
MNRLLIKDGMILTFINEAYEATRIDHQDILIHDGKIVCIKESIDAQPGDEVIQVPGQMIIPGLINAHNHTLTTSVCRGMTDDYNRVNYGGSALYTRVFPLKRIALQHLDDNELKAILKLSMLEMIDSGTTTVGEQCTGRDVDIFIELAQELGLRASVCPMYTSGQHLPELQSDGRIEIGQIREEMKVLYDNIALHEKYHGAGNGLIQVWMGPHAPDSCSTELLVETAKAAKELNTQIMIHLAQTKVEVEKIKNRCSRSPVEYLDEIGFLSDRVVAAHGIFTDDEDRDIIARRNATIVHCPQVFAKGGMIAPFGPYVKKGVNVAIGTDSYSMDAMAEMRMAAILGKILAGNAHEVTATDVFFAATVGGAKAFKRPDLGRIAEGQTADITILDMDKPHIQPVAVPVINLVYHVLASDVTYVIVNGKIIKSPCGVLGVDYERALHEGKKTAEKIWAAARSEGIL